MSLFNLFRKKPILYSLQDIGIDVDMHSHLLAGIDDGATSPEQGLEMVKALNELGYRKFICTPHVMGDYFKNSPSTINNALSLLKNVVKDEGIEVELSASAEYFLDEWFPEKLENKELNPFGNNYVLVETSYLSKPPNLEDMLFRMKIAGYKPVIAHPERYSYMYDKFEKYRDLHQREVYFQINLTSLSGYYSPAAKKIAEQLIAEKMVDFVGTDFHHMRHLRPLKEAMKSPFFGKLADLDLLNRSL